MTDTQHFGTPSPWVVKHAPLIPAGGLVLDLACGKGRHAVWLAQHGYQVEAVDLDAAALAGMAGLANIQLKVADVESASWPYAGQFFDGIVVSRYLHRPLLPVLAECLNHGGVLIYETFMVGNERHGRPSKPDFLLLPGELLSAYSTRLSVVAFEQGQELAPKPAVMQRICAIYNPSVDTIPEGA